MNDEDYYADCYYWKQEKLIAVEECIMIIIDGLSLYT